MSKIVQAVNVMISNPQLINKVAKGAGELFFLYKNKYVWSMKRDSEETFLWYYPEASTFDDLLNTARSSSWENVTMVTYSDSEIGTREARASFAELYTLLNEKLYGIDAMFKDILSDVDDDLPF